MDVLCLQECDSTDIPDEINGLTLAASTKTNRLGLALYYRERPLRAARHQPLRADEVDARPRHGPGPRAAAGRAAARPAHRPGARSWPTSTPLRSPRRTRLRRKQIGLAHEKLSELAGGVPTVMVGDFNYPWFRQGLRKHLLKTGLRALDHRRADLRALGLQRPLRLRHHHGDADRERPVAAAGQVGPPSDPAAGERAPSQSRCAGRLTYRAECLPGHVARVR